MSSVFTVFCAAMAVNSFLQVAAGPADIKFTSPVSNRDDIPSSINALHVGDIIAIRDAQILRRRETDYEYATVYDRYATESPYTPVSKRAHSNLGEHVSSGLFRRVEPFVWQGVEKEPDVYNCGGIRVQLDNDMLASGSSGRVYRAIRQTGEKFAMKGAVSESVRNHEWAMMEKVGEHPNIMRKYAQCSIEAMYYIMLELLPKRTLQHQIEEKAYQGEAKESTAKSVIAQVFKGIQHSHSKGVAHQDIKGDNVMFSESGVVKIIDFGMAIASEGKKVKSIDVAGGIRSPEAETGSAAGIDPISNDTWELGVLLMYMINGQKPWTSATAADAKPIWSKTTKELRSEACKAKWPAFSPEFCDVLAFVFVEEKERKPLSWFAGEIAKPGLKFYDDCGEPKKTRRTNDDGELVVVDVEDAGSKWIVRAMMV